MEDWGILVPLTWVMNKNCQKADILGASVNLSNLKVPGALGVSIVGLCNGELV